MADSFLLSVVTVNMNNAGELPKTLDSLEQLRGRPEVELIFIDGASTDDSVAIARPFYDASRLISEKDSGIYNAMNKGLGLANGTYVVWMNSGDHFLPGIADTLLDELRTSNADMIAFGTKLVNEDGSLIRMIDPTGDAVPPGLYIHQSTVFRREAVASSGGYRENMKIAADIEMEWRITRAGGPVRVVATPLSVFTRGGVSWTNDEARRRERLELSREYGLVSPLRYRLALFRYDHPRLYGLQRRLLRTIGVRR